uniref:NADH-ubiquinone oxidoreductase chain 6 n=1 Tax=Lycus dentipes TaxID=908259 RepID=E3VT87_9COLE|nr:NADH dehydrogenase subunit 6 [Lycus dentipes]
MLTIMLISVMTISLSFIFLNHPITMGLALLLQTVAISLTTGLMMNMFWYSYIIFMIMIGGMLVLFLYMTSIASNKKFKFSIKLSIFLFIMMMIFMIMLMLNDFYSEILMKTQLNLEMTVLKYFNFPTGNIMILLITYLLITLIAVVKITKTNFGPLRQK